MLDYAELGRLVFSKLNVFVGEMNKAQFQRAEEHRLICGEKLDDLASAPDFRRATVRWSEFLTSHHRWFTRMQQAFGSGPSSAWFGKLKALRRDSQLLTYLHQARHADEHGLDPIAEGQGASFVMGRGGAALRIESLTINNGQIAVSGSEGGLPIVPEFIPSHLKLNPVIQRGVVYQPPAAPVVRPPLVATVNVPLTALQAGAKCKAIMSDKAIEGAEHLDKAGL